MQIENHCLTSARYLASPFYNERPSQIDITMIVLHNISLPPNQFGGQYIADFFTGHLDYTHDPSFASLKELQVSAHLLIDRLGQVTQFVPFNYRAWHAGVSSFAGRENCNDFSIGIELEGSDFVAYTEEQYASLAQVLPTLFKHYPTLRSEEIVGHEHIAPGRKSDPGPFFDWSRILLLV